MGKPKTVPALELSSHASVSHEDRLMMESLAVEIAQAKETEDTAKDSRKSFNRELIHLLDQHKIEKFKLENFTFSKVQGSNTSIDRTRLFQILLEELKTGAEVAEDILKRVTVTTMWEEPTIVVRSGK